MNSHLFLTLPIDHQTQVFENEASVFGFISLPSKTQVSENEEPLFGFSTLPSQTQLLGNSNLFDINFPLGN